MTQPSKSFPRSVFGHLHALLVSFGLLVSLLLLSVFQGITDLDSRLSLPRLSRDTASTQSLSHQSQRADWLGQKATSIARTLRISGIRHATVYNRVKSIESTAEKLKRKGLSSPEELNDLYGMRIVVDNELDVYRSLNVLCSQYETVPGTLKNYIAHPKASGYQSVHVVSKIDGKRVEFQLRTQAMHEQAEAEHEAYKSRVRVV